MEISYFDHESYVITQLHKIKLNYMIDFQHYYHKLFDCFDL